MQVAPPKGVILVTAKTRILRWQVLVLPVFVVGDSVHELVGLEIKEKGWLRTCSKLWIYSWLRLAKM